MLAKIAEWIKGKIKFFIGAFIVTGGLFILFWLKPGLFVTEFIGIGAIVLCAIVLAAIIFAYVYKKPVLSLMDQAKEKIKEQIVDVVEKINDSSKV